MTRGLSALAALRERLEKATGSSYETNAMIWCALVTGEEYEPESLRRVGDTLIHRSWNVPDYLASLDAALALVERAQPGEATMFVVIALNIATVWERERGGPLSRWLALALCLALVRALEAQATEDAP